MHAGDSYLTRVLADITDDELTGSLQLPGWTGKHVLAHLAGNARALGRLTRWAATGEVTPMYASPEERTREIGDDAALSGPALRDALIRDQAALDADLAAMPEDGWSAHIRTVQGRELEASVIPWLRTRELWIHAADLTGGDYSEFPQDLLESLISDVLQRRRDALGERMRLIPTDGAAGTGPPPLFDTSDSEKPPTYRGTLAALARWVTGRGPEGVAAEPGTALSELGPWL